MVGIALPFVLGTFVLVGFLSHFCVSAVAAVTACVTDEGS